MHLPGEEAPKAVDRACLR